MDFKQVFSMISIFLKINLVLLLFLAMLFLAPFLFGESPRESVAETMCIGGYFVLGTLSSLYLMTIARKFAKRTYAVLLAIHFILFALPLLGIILAVILGIFPEC